MGWLLGEILGALADSAMSGVGRRPRRGPGLFGVLGVPLSLVMIALGLLGAALVSRQVEAGELGAVVPLMLLPFGGTLLAGLAGAVGLHRAAAAGVVSLVIALGPGILFGATAALLGGMSCPPGACAS